MAFNNLVDITRLQYFLEKLKALIPSASSAAPGKIASSSSQGSSVNYARQDHTHGIDIATGDSNGQVKIAGSNVSVKGLAALAYKASLGKSDVGLGNVDNVKQYSASNPPPYPVTSVNGSTGAVTVSVPSAATTNPKMDGTAAVGSSAKYAKEDHVHPSDTTKVSTSGNETISGNKTFSGTTSITPASTYAAPVNTVIPANATAIIQSPIPKYLWHDLFAFNRVKEPLYYTTTDGTSWTEATLEKRLFSHQEAWGTVNIISSSISGSRWVWTTNGALHACSGAWLVIGVGYSSTISHYDVLFEQSTDGTTWTTLATATNLSHQSVPIWIKTNGAISEKYIRLTITRNSSSGTSTNMPIVSIRWLTARWGNQGLGSEYEYPYQWNGTPDIYPLKNDTSELGTSSYKWKNINATKLNGVDVGSSPKFTDTTYESKAAASGGTAVSLVTTGEKYTWNNKGTYSKPSGGIPDSDIASAATWNAKGNGTITGITMNGASKGTSGVVNLGTVITAHQDISGKADKSATVSNVAYDSTNKKITKTINGTTSDVVTAATLKTAMALNNVENKSSATIRGELTKANVTTALGYTPSTTDTTYESKTAASGGTDVSLVTTGEKYTWNSKQAALVSGTNIKTINGSSLLGSGNLAVSGLPAVTSSDNDKVLKVVSGAWAAAKNGGGQFIVNVQYLNGQYKSNKTHKQIMDAIDAGYTVVVRYDNTYYNLEAYVSSSKYVSFSQTHYLDSDSSVLVRYFTMSGGDDVDTFTKYSNGVQKLTYPQNPNPICSVYYDDAQARYVFSYEGKSDFSEVFANGAIEDAPILKWEEGFCDPLDEEQPDVYTKMFALTDAYTTNEDWTYTGHLVFSRIIDGTVPKIERFEISQDFNIYDTFISATVTYSEKPLGGSMPVNAAVIHVNAPLGSAITFFKDSTVMEAVTAAQTHPNADGKTEDYYYSVPTSDFGSWTVAASKSGKNDATQSFSILVAKQYDAFLSYLAPYDFQAVEWIQTSTNAYFDTGIIPTTTNYTTKVSLQVAVTNGGIIFNVEGGYGMEKVTSYEQLRYYYVGGQTALNVSGVATVGTDFEIIYNNDSGVVMINGVEVVANPNIRALDNRQYSILVAAGRYGSTVSYYGTWRYKRFTVLERDTKNVLIDMHPCYRKMDNMPGFWDSVSNTFMTQLGTGIITVGPDV